MIFDTVYEWATEGLLNADALIFVEQITYNLEKRFKEIRRHKEFIELLRLTENEYSLIVDPIRWTKEIVFWDISPEVLAAYGLEEKLRTIEEMHKAKWIMENRYNSMRMGNWEENNQPF